MTRSINVPVAICIFKRKDTTKEVIESIRKVRPSKLYIVGEGPRDNVPGEDKLVMEVRKIVENAIDWPCEVHKNYADKNMGCGKRIPSGISWVFEHEEMAIIIEDDVLADPSFYYFAEEMLNKYKDQDNVMMVTGHKEFSKYKQDNSYFFARFGSIWGWATWKRAWDKYDRDIKCWPDIKKSGELAKEYISPYVYSIKAKQLDSILEGFDTWDYQWDFARMINHGLSIIPAENLIMNCGFRADATHTTANNDGKETIGELNTLAFPLKHPSMIVDDISYDAGYQKQNFPSSNIIARCIRKAKKIMRKAFS